MAKSQEPTAEQKRYWTRVAALGCLVCRRPPQIAHMHGPELCAIDPALLKPKAKKFRWQHWLVAPLCPEHHWLFDNRPEAFIVRWGNAVDLLRQVQSRLGVDGIALARAMVKRSLPVRIWEGPA
jgi:hypothetical protein